MYYIIGECENMKDREKLKKRLKRAIGTDEIIGEHDLLELHGLSELIVRGCGAILYYSETEIKLSMKKYVLKISGRELYCVSYLAGAVEIDGEIEALELLKRGRDV